MECRAPIDSHFACFVYIQLRNAHGCLGSKGGSFDMYPTLDRGLAPTLQMQVEVVDELFRHFNKRNVAGKAAIIPPVRLPSWDAVGQASVVHCDHDKIPALFEQASHLAVEGSKSALVLADLLPIHPYVGPVVRRAHMTKHPRSRFALIRKILSIPHRPLVEKEGFTLCIPMAGYLQNRRLLKIVLNRLTTGSP